MHMPLQSNAMSFHGLGVTEHSQSTFTVSLIADLAAITGNIGRQIVGCKTRFADRTTLENSHIGMSAASRGAGYGSYDPEMNKYELHYGRSVPIGKGLKIPMWDG